MKAMEHLYNLTLGGFPQLEDSISKDESKRKNIKLADIMRGKPAKSGWHGYDLLQCLFFSKAPQDFNYNPRRPCKSWLLFSDFNVVDDNIASTCNPSDIAYTHPLDTIYGVQSGEKGLVLLSHALQKF
ncbi:hypothetical protein VNO80_18327 [Phaseolus coccineus]|uniref:Uncharacterized protein n=1 Tax=Phaseolus coccineus TaxID=3886 RepID=A0AAN9QZD0_PHACN